jgi:hypothetical protein
MRNKAWRRKQYKKIYKQKFQIKRNKRNKEKKYCKNKKLQLFFLKKINFGLFDEI